MNVFEVAHQVNDRLYGGNESMFEMVFIIVSEFLSSYKPYCRVQFAKEKLLSNHFDFSIVGMIDAYMNDPISSEGRLSMINYFHRKFKYYRDMLSDPFFNLDEIPHFLGDDTDDYLHYDSDDDDDFAPADYYEAPAEYYYVLADDGTPVEYYNGEPVEYIYAH